MANRPVATPQEIEKANARDIWELVRLPALFGVATAVITWLIWYYTTAPCTPEAATLTGCNPAIIARYINVDIYGKMLTYSAILAGVGGVWNYDMFTKMRAAIAAERSRADEAEKQFAEYRQQSEAQLAEYRQQSEAQLAEHRQQSEARLAEYRQQSEAERRRAEEERRQEHESFMAALAEERRRSDENQQAFMATLSEITAQLARLAERQNGNGQGGH